MKIFITQVFALMVIALIALVLARSIIALLIIFIGIGAYIGFQNKVSKKSILRYLRKLWKVDN